MATVSTFSTYYNSSPDGFWTDFESDGWRVSKFLRIAGGFFFAVLTCIFAIVGSVVGAIAGGTIGLATESGLFRGAGIGAISGAVFFIESFDYTLALWHSRDDGSGTTGIIFVIDILDSLLSGRLVREKVDPAVQSAIRSQMSVIDDDRPFEEAFDIFDTGEMNSVAVDSMEKIFIKLSKISKMKISDENKVDSWGDTLCCSVCLQDFQVGETVRNLPNCRHMFHLPCIDRWLVKRTSCPLCRTDV